MVACTIYKFLVFRANAPAVFGFFAFGEYRKKIIAAFDDRIMFASFGACAHSRGCLGNLVANGNVNFAIGFQGTIISNVSAIVAPAPNMFADAFIRVPV